MTNMTNAEHLDATKALMRWFQSQEIEPGDAGIIMVKVIACQLTCKTTHLPALQTGINLINLMLATEVVSYIHGS